MRITKALLIAGAIGVGAVALTACGTATASSTSPASANHEVVYKVTGTATTVSLTMQTSDGGTSQVDATRVPLTSKSGKDGLTMVMEAGDFFYISAQNQGSSGSVTCTVEVDGVPVKTTTSQGEYVIAACSGTV